MSKTRCRKSRRSVSRRDRSRTRIPSARGFRWCRWVGRGSDTVAASQSGNDRRHRFADNFSRGVSLEPAFCRGSTMNLEELVTVTPGVRSGKPCIAGSRITVYDILEYLAGGMTEQEILADFPTLRL